MSPYLKPNRLQDIIGALQIMGSNHEYKMKVEDWKEIIENDPLSAKSWRDVFTEHPEFFRKNDKELFSLIWRGFASKVRMPCWIRSVPQRGSVGSHSVASIT